MINCAIGLHTLVYALFWFTYSTQKQLGNCFQIHLYRALNHSIDHRLFIVCRCLSVSNSSHVQDEPADRMVDWYQAPGSVDRAICDKPRQGVIRRSGL